MNPFEQTFNKPQSAEDKAKPKTVTNPSDSSNHSDSVDSTDSTDSIINKNEQTDIDAIRRRMANTQNTVLNRLAASLHSKTKQKFSKRINITADANTMAAVCDITGAVVAVTFPRIKNKVFSYISPLSILANCRGIAQEGKDYMRRLDTQTVAAIFITLAEHYDLLRSQPSDSGAQKNAILRTVAKDILIDGILMIEDFVHSTNCAFIPKLSIIFTTDIEQNGVQARFQSWASVAMEAIKKPDLEEYDGRKKRHTIPYSVSQTKKATVAFNKEFRAWKTEAKQTILSMYSAKQISPKLKEFLVAVTSNDNLMHADPAAIDLLCVKLNQLNLESAAKLAIKIMSFKSKLDDMNDSSDWLDEMESFSAQKVGSSLEQPKAKAVSSPNPSANESANPSDSTDFPAINDSADSTNETAHAAPSGMSFIERLKAKKAAEKQAQQEQRIEEDKAVQQAMRKENDDAPF